MQEEENQQPPFEMAINPKQEGWFDGQRYIPFNQLSNKHLQAAKLHCQRKELEYLNKSGFFAKMADKLDKEAESRGKSLKDYDTDYHKNNRYFKNINAGKENNYKPKWRESGKDSPKG